MTDQPISSELLARVLSGQASPDDQAAVDTWLAQGPANQAEFESLRQSWKENPSTETWDVDQAWRKVASRIASPEAATPTPVLAFPSRPTFRWALQMAAAVTVIIGLGFAWRIFRPHADDPITYLTALAETRTVTLPDGTQVELAPQSTVTLDVGYGLETRTLTFTGEGTFTVAHDETKPFRVRARGTVTEDLGTTFVIRAVESERAVRLVLVEGAASFRSEGTEPSTAVELGPQDIAVLTDGDSAVAVTRQVPATTLDAMRPGRFVAENARLDSALIELNRWSKRVVRLADTTQASRRFTATLSLTDLDEALSIIGLTLGLSVTQVADTVLLR